MSRAQSFTIGDFRCHLLEAGLLRLDGGAMFGVVPKPLWSLRIGPDERNRISLAMRCLLIEHPEGLVLIDTGLGDKEDAKFHDIYAVHNTGDPGPTWLEDALREAGHRPEEVRWVINTHLHFDHAGETPCRLGERLPRRPDHSDWPSPTRSTSSSATSSNSPGTPMSEPERATFPAITSRWIRRAAGN